MTKRFGRKQKRKFREEVKRLEYAAFGPYGECPKRITSIDDLPITSKSIRISDDPRSYYDVSVSIDVASYDFDRIQYMQNNPVRLDGRCLIATNVNVPHIGRLQTVCCSIDFKQIVAPR
jgi:hypothetical protein